MHKIPHQLLIITAVSQKHGDREKSRHTGKIMVFTALGYSS